jgi:hypothetical protein
MIAVPHHELRCRVSEEHQAVEGTSSDVSRFPPSLGRVSKVARPLFPLNFGAGR